MKTNRFFSIVITYSIVMLLAIFLPGMTTASEELQEVDIYTSPENILFDVTNMKPGDWATRTLTIGNSGNEDFSYLTSADLKSGSEKLYNELKLTISDQVGEVYNGKLGSFKKLEPRLITTSNKEDLTFTVKFPEELGNEFQGLASIVEFKFYVEGTLGGVLPVDNRLPDTATNMFNYLIAGAVLLIGGASIMLYQRKRKLDTRR